MCYRGKEEGPTVLCLTSNLLCDLDRSLPSLGLGLFSCECGIWTGCYLCPFEPCQPGVRWPYGRNIGSVVLAFFFKQYFLKNKFHSFILECGQLTVALLFLPFPILKKHFTRLRGPVAGRLGTKMSTC